MLRAMSPRPSVPLTTSVLTLITLTLFDWLSYDTSLLLSGASAIIVGRPPVVTAATTISLVPSITSNSPEAEPLETAWFEINTCDFSFDAGAGAFVVSCGAPPQQPKNKNRR